MSDRTKEHLIALQTILTKEIIRFTRIWQQTILPPAITATLYFIIFGKLIGSQIHDIAGFNYMQYIVPGLAMMSIMTNAYANTSSSFFGAKFSRNIEEMLVSPMPNYVIILGYMLGGTLRGVLVGMVVIGIAMFFTHLHFHSITVVMLMAVISAMLFSLGGLVNGIFARKFDDVAFIPTFILTPLTYLGGVFYSIQALPPFWRTLSIFNPIFDIVDTFKFGMLGIADLNVYVGISLVLGLFVALFVTCLIIMQKGIGLRS